MTRSSKASTAGSSQHQARHPLAVLGTLAVLVVLLVAAAPAGAAVVTTDAASGTTPTTTTLNGTVNPEGVAITECFFEWGLEKGPLDQSQTYPETAACVPSAAGIGSGTSPVAVQAELSGLQIGTVYHYRLKAADASETVTGEDMSVQTAGPVVDGPWSEDVVYTEATLKAQIDPEGQATTYHFEYGTSEAYGSETPELAVGSDSSVHELTRFLDGLSPGTTYHYRVIATNSVATNVSPDRTFTTFEPFAPDTGCANQAFRTGASANLPDCRAYEMVSPVSKNNADIATICNILCNRTAANQAALDGDKVAYTSYKAFGDAIGSLYANQYIASRKSIGWFTHGITPYHKSYLYKFQPFSAVWDTDIQFRAFTEDLETTWITDDADPPLTPDAVPGRVNLYQRDNQTDSYQPLFTQLPTSGTSSDLGYNMMVGGHSQNGDHLVFSAEAAFTPDAAPGAMRQLYDYTGGELQLVSILPNGTANSQESKAGGGDVGPSSREATLYDAVSRDGSKIYWTSSSGPLDDGQIYVRVNGTSTVAVSETVSSANAQYLTASTDGSKALFMIGEDLYEFDLATESSSLVAGGAYGLMGASDDLARIYFVSKEVLDAGATTGQSNLYVDDEGSVKFIATLSLVDRGEGQAIEQVSGYSVVDTRPLYRASRVSVDGSTAAFQSVASLTGYDNTNTANGEPNLQVYVYDAEELHCVSCRPSGARSVGRELQIPFHAKPGSPFNNNGGPERRWTAAWLTTAERPTYSPRNLSDDGNRLYFNAFDGLLPQDTNGQQDVYQWEAEGTGTCEEEGGCLSLISSGKSPEKSEFVDASADGRDVFFSTSSNLVGQDTGLIDIYDARAGGGFPPPPPSPPPCVGDSCQSVPAAPNDPTPASAGFRGAGDPKARKARRLCKPRNRASKSSKRVERKRVKRCRGANRRAAR